MSAPKSALRDLDYYRVQHAAPWWRRKWQAEWDGCRWAQRGYTRAGIAAMVYLRRTSPAVDMVYVRTRIAIRRTYRDWYRQRYTITGKPRATR